MKIFLNICGVKGMMEEKIWDVVENIQYNNIAWSRVYYFLMIYGYVYQKLML